MFMDIVVGMRQRRVLPRRPKMARCECGTLLPAVWNTRSVDTRRA